MSVITRAWYYVTRKRSKSLIMFLILFGISTAMISGVAIKKATVDARNQVNESINASFQLEINLMNNMGVGDRGLGNIPVSAINQIKEIDGITKHSARMVGLAELIDLQRVKIDNPRVQYDASMDELYKDIIDLNGTSNSSLDNKFVGGAMTLTEGRHISPEDVHKVLVHEEFAKLNQLKIHDKIAIKASEYDSMAVNNNGENIELEIIGLFSGSNMASAMDEMELIENVIMTDNEAVKTLYGYNEETAIYQDANFYVSDPKELTTIMDKVHELPIDWKDFHTIESSASYPALTDSLDSMDGLINKMIIGVIVVSALILSLILAFWVNGRIHETGVLLSLGISKTNIITQYIVELFMIAIVSFGLSYFSGQVIAQNIGDSMVQQAGETSAANLQNSLGGMQLGADPESGLVSKTLDSIDVSITLADMGYVWLLGGLVILLSVSISSIFIIRLKPKEILSKMS